MTRHAAAGLAALLLAICLLSVWALSTGSTRIDMLRVLAILVHGGEDREALLVLTVRLPRLIAALLIGAALATSGAIIQRITRNPMADPGLVGINAGAVLAVVLIGSLTGLTARGDHVWAAFTGGLMAAGLVWLLAGGARASPIRLILSGVVVGGFLMSVTTMTLLADSARLDSLRFWTTGSLTGVQMPEISRVAPWIGAGFLAAVLSARPLDIMAMGDEMARALGLPTGLWRIAALAGAVLLAAGAVALAGPVGFLGLIVPHAVRLTVGHGALSGLPFWITAGAALSLVADTLPRAVAGRDVPVGITLALIGAPFFLLIATRRRR